MTQSARACSRCASWPCVCRQPEQPDAYERRPMPQLHRIGEPCACGGPDIVAETRIVSDITAAILRHQVEPAHIAWQIAHGIEPGPRGDVEGELERDLARELVAR